MRCTLLGIQRGTKILPSRESISVLAKEKKHHETLNIINRFGITWFYMVGTQLAQYRLSVTSPGHLLFWWVHGSL